MKTKSALERELDQIRDASIQAIADAWYAVRAADGRLKTSERRLTVSALKGETHKTVSDLVAHPIGDEILQYRIVIKCSEAIAGILYKIKTAMAEDAGVKSQPRTSEHVDDEPPTAPDPYAAIRKRK